jgi:hypothetical protein
LCSVAFDTTTPPTVTGSSRAIGVSAPVRPTWMSIALMMVVAFSAGNLCAIAQRGLREPFLPVEPVDLVDHAVDVVAEGGALLFDVAVEREQVVDAVADARERIGLEAACT